MFFTSMEHLHKQKDKELSFYNFQSRETVASIGAQCCHWEGAYASSTDSVIFYFEDIDSSKLNTEQVKAVWDYYSVLRGKKMTSQYQIILGSENATLLPDKIFDKIIIINSFHEFTYKEQMLKDIKEKLKPGGILYIDEALPRKPGQLHGVCNLPMFTEQQMIDFFSNNGFAFKEGLDFTFRKKTVVRKIFAFIINE